MSTVSSRIDLRKFAQLEVYNQGQENSCVANALIHSIRLQSREYHKDSGDLAREQTYYDSRASNNNAQVDSGTSVESQFKVAQTIGIGDQSKALPYSGSNAPGSSMYLLQSPALYTDAATQKVFGRTDYNGHILFKNGEFSQGLESDPVLRQKAVWNVVDTELMHGKPVVIGLALREWFTTQTNLTTPVDISKTTEVGSHAALIVGRDNALDGGSYIVMNSWGTGFGDNGYGHIPYRYLNHENGLRTLDVSNGFAGIDLTWTPTREDSAMLYATVLDRAADHTGMEFWSSALASGTTLTQAANMMLNSTEGVGKYGSMSNSTFVDQMYLNTMNRHVDSAGSTFWTSLLNDGSMTRAGVAVSLMQSVEQQGGAITVAEHDYLINRTTASANFALTYQLETNNTNNKNLAISVLDNITSSADSVQTALIGVQSFATWA